MDPRPTGAASRHGTQALAVRAGGRLPGLPALPAHGACLRLLLLMGAGYVLLWGAAVALTYSAPDADSAEQFVWAASLEAGYFKHPPLPSWIMHALLALFGPSLALPVVAAQLCIVAALVLTWRLGCEFMSPRRSLVATLLTSLVTYHNIGGDSFNHNTALLPFQAAALLLFYLAARRGDWIWWALAGLFAGLSVLVKYVALAPLAGLLLYFALDRGMHRRRAWLGLLLAAGVFALVLLPHLRWLVADDFMPLRYARAVARERPDTLAPLPGVADFLFTQLQRLAPMLIALAWLRAAGRRGAPAARAPAPVPPLPRADRLFFWIAALSPITIVVAIGLCGAAALVGRWGANAFLLSGHAVMLLLPARFPDAAGAVRPLRRTLRVVVLLQVMLCAGQTLGKTIGAAWLARPTRPNLPGALLAQQARQAWRQQPGPGLPLRLVASDSWLGGTLIAHSGRRPPEVLIDGSRRLTPWVAPDAIERCGVLVLEDVTHDRHAPTAPSPELDALMARASIGGIWTLPWVTPPRRADAAPRAHVRWGIVAAQPGAGRCPIGEPG